MPKLRAVWRTVPNRLLRYLLDPAWFWLLLGNYEDEPIRFDAWQIADLHDYSKIRFREKAPQIGASWLRACEAVWEAMMFEDATTSFVSVDQREASEKVLYAHKLYDGLPSVIHRAIPIVKDSVEELSWGNEHRPSRVLSLPNTSALRGRKMSVVLDEADFYKDGGAAAYRAAIGRITRGGRVTCNSTCWGVGTTLDKMMQGRDETGEVLEEADVVSRARFPWPVAENEQAKSGIELARLTLPEEDFAEEYSCVRASGASDPFPAQLLRERTHEEALAAFVPDAQHIGRLVFEPTGMMWGGYDVGKGTGRHPSILSLYHQDPDGVWRQVALHQPSRRDQPLSLPEQHEWLIEMMHRYPQLRLVPDVKGIGEYIGQALVREFGNRRVIPMAAGSKPQNHKMQDKTEMIVETKRALEADEVELMSDREQFQEFRHTKKGPDGKFVQLGSDKRAHFDRFWATVYAVYGIGESRKMHSAYRRHGLVVIGGEERESVFS